MIKLKIIFILIVSIIIIQSGCGKEHQNNLSLKELKFESIFGVSEKDPNNIYCLLGTGFFRAPRSENSDSLIIQWMNSHPKAIVIPISSLEEKSNSKMTYCWIVEEKDTLNNYLIKNGCFPGGTMMRPKTWEDMGEKESGMKVHVDKDVYDRFIEQIKEAEIYARNNKIGIWQKEEEE